ncbi:MAG: hybrid sensor histidine kinase/response regulator [Pseudomonadota bacterium]|nr:hybrid sensor histidine kinase/response regulator [Pseudomonadota bacterium]
MSGPSPDTLAVKCLIVDDLDENLLAMSALLRADGVELLLARSGREALELLLQHEVALALVDVQMPEMDGFELAELMRGSERTRRVPIIFVTAGGNDRQRVFQGYDSGAVDFLFKPVEARVVRSKAEVFFRLERQARQLARQVEERTEALRLYEMFTGVLGHDLRGPLAAILVGAQKLARSEDEGTRRIAERLIRSAQWMGRMVEDTLDLTRARIGGGIAVRRAPMELGELVERVAGERLRTQPERAMRIEREANLVGRWDADRLAQVVSNLVGNALSHGDPSVPVEVRVAEGSSGRVELSVSNGGTIAPEVLPHIFDPFRSGRDTTHRTEGLGLGLYIVQQIVQAHAGTITVTTGSGQPTVFRVELPR